MESTHRQSGQPIDPARLGATIDELYHNRSLTAVNDHELRMSVMTAGFGWHAHPDSDELFLAVEGGLVVETEEGEILLRPGQAYMVMRGKRHRTRPEGKRSVNITFERADAQTIFEE